MMINTERIKLEGLNREVTVSEIRARKAMQLLPFLRDLAQKKGEEEQVEKSFLQLAEDVVKEVCGLSPDELFELYPSDMEVLWQAFQKVNTFFFKTAKGLGIAEQLGKVLKSILSGVGEQLAASLQADILAHLTTDSPGLSGPGSSGENNETPG